MTYRRIAVPLDGTVESEHALRWALALARRAKCPLDLVHAIIQPPVAAELYGAPTVDAAIAQQRRAAVVQRLEKLAAGIAALGLRANVIVIDGIVTETLANQLGASDIDLIVMTTHDRGRLERFVLGSVTESVTHHAHNPVLVIRPTEGGVAFDSQPELSRLLIPLDGSGFAEQILPHAARLASLTNAEIVLLGVNQPVLAVGTVAHGEPRLAELERAADALRRNTGLVVRTDVVSDGRPAHAILDYAQQHAVDVVAMTTHGHGALKRLVAGSVSEAVLRTSRFPMLLFRPDEVDSDTHQSAHTT